MREFAEAPERAFAETPGTAPRRATLGLIASLYVTQGIPLGVAFDALPAILRQEGYDTAVIGLVGVMMLPWAIKFFWAPFVDRFSGLSVARRRRWIWPAQTILAGLFLAIALWPAGAKVGAAAFVLLLIANFVSATQDIATDGLAVEALPKRTLGWANGIQIGGFALGMLIGGALTTLLYDVGGWTLSFGMLSAIVLLTLLPVLSYRSDNPQPTAQDAPRGASPKPGLKKLIARRGALYMISIAATFYFGRAMAGAMTGPFLVDAGFSLSHIALVNGAGIGVITLVAGLLGAVLVTRAGAQRTAIGAGSIAALTLFLWLIPARGGSPGMPEVLGIVLLNGAASGVLYVAVFTLFMQWASRDQAGTDVSLLQCSETLTNIPAIMIGGVVAGALGFAANYLVAGLLAAAAMAWIIYALARLRGHGELVDRQQPLRR